ncbi:hypothetical protein [Pelosinus sp. IPA-1]|uniref:hypothetical protein n=1 Tax=Pelosinus sp. IPA-1 TaxID=3029569 RepID=UPI00255292DB|nr:hypothetical protein [Pelosinus sp. IPA-1]
MKKFLLMALLMGAVVLLITGTAIASANEEFTRTVCQKVEGQEKLYRVPIAFETVELVDIVSTDKTNRTKTRVQPDKWSYDKENSVLTLDQEVDNVKYVVVIQGEKAVPWVLKHIKAKPDTIKMVVNDRIGISGVDFFYDPQQQKIVFSKELSHESTCYYLIWQNEDGSYSSMVNTQLTDKMRELMETQSQDNNK